MHDKRCHHLSFPWRPVDCACVCAREGHPHQRIEAQLLIFYWCVFLLTLCRWRKENWHHLSSFLGAVIFDWARARRRRLLQRNHHIELLIVVSSFLSLCGTRRLFSLPSPFFLLTGARSQHVRNLAAGRASKLVCAAWCPASLKNIIMCHLWEQMHDFFLCRGYKEGCWACKRQGERKNWFVLMPEAV